METLIKKLEAKWGSLENGNEYYKLKNLNGRGKNYLHILFKSLGEDRIKELERKLEARLHPDLYSFYKEYNGLVLFSGSVRIFGIENKDAKELYKTSDILYRDASLKLQYLSSKFKDYIFFGNYSRWYFGFNKHDYSKFYVVDQKNEEIVHNFKTLSELLNYYTDNLIDEYDDTGHKINCEKLSDGTPISELSFTFI